jgi:hypothetical protein
MKRLVGFLPLAVYFIFALLLFRNPFSDRTLIPNLEPYPDTFHYIVPARSLVSGGPFAITRGFGEIKPGVPPFYSLALAPFFALFNDPRMFYIANVVFASISFYLLYLILKTVTKNIWIQCLVLFLYATNFFIYWYPQFAMAENLILPIFLAGILILNSKIDVRKAFVAGIITLSFFATKYASVALSGAYLLVYLIKSKGRLLFIYIGTFTTFALLLFLFLGKVLGTNPLDSLVNVVNAVFLGGSQSTGREGTSWFSSAYISENLSFYFRSLMGEPGRFMWDFTPILSGWLAILGTFGLLIGVIRKKNRFLCGSLIVLISAQVLFISSFYSVDNRYIYPAVPGILIGFAVLLSNIKGRYLYIALGLIFGLYSLTNIIRVKNQVMLNLKYAETPWYYVSVQKVNDYFTGGNVSDKNKPYVITPMPPFYFDYFSNGNYKLLPLQKDQEFRFNREAAWGQEDYSDLQKLYKKHIVGGDLVYVSTYGLGNEAYLNEAFKNLYKDFNLTEVMNECYTQCRLYKLELKNAKSN